MTSERPQTRGAGSRFQRSAKGAHSGRTARAAGWSGFARTAACPGRCSWCLKRAPGPDRPVWGDRVLTNFKGCHAVGVKLVVRSPGYIGVCAGQMAFLLLLSIVAFLDPSPGDSRGPAWAFWIWATVLVLLLARAPFVGLVMRDDRITRRSWVRSRSWPKSDITGVATASYSSSLNHGSQSGRFRMIVLTTGPASSQRTVDVPEVCGGHKMEDRLRMIAAAMDLSEPSPVGRHRGG